MAKTTVETQAKTAAQRQAAYRARRANAGREGNGERRLSLWVETGVALASVGCRVGRKSWRGPILQLQ